MARITVEDCLKNVDNQFDLVLTAAKRARQLANGAEPLLEWENDKPTVVALREIAAGLITDEVLAEMSQPIDDILSSEDAEELLASTPLPSLDSAIESLLPSIATVAETKQPKVIPAPIAKPEPEVKPELQAEPEPQPEAIPATPALQAEPEPEATPELQAEAEAEPEPQPPVEPESLFGSQTSQPAADDPADQGSAEEPKTDA